MPERVKDFGTVEITLTFSQFWTLPQKTRDLIRLYGTERATGLNTPSKIEIARSRMSEIAETLDDDMPDMAEAFRRFGQLGQVATIQGALTCEN